MRYNRVGQTGIQLSAIGFGTAQLRMVPEAQAIATLLRGIELGVNWMHCAPDYGGSEELVAEAIRRSGREDVILASGCYGSPEKVEELFEATCRIRGKSRLALYGICCVDDREFVGENVWEPGGMVEFLAQKKAEGRIGATFCTTHGPPDYVAKLIESGAFDAIMLANNPLGFHVLSYHARSEGKAYEDIAENRRSILPLAARNNVSLLIMKPFAGGILCSSKAFPPRRRFTTEPRELDPTDVLRASLVLPGVTAVCPGTASVEEAEENARAGHEPIELSAAARAEIEPTVSGMRNELCSRCGECEPTCSKGLPISWMIREAYMWSYPADSFDAIDRHHYFNQHPSTTLACATCTRRTCECPYGLDIPKTLHDVHELILDYRERGLMHDLPRDRDHRRFDGHVQGAIVCSEIPAEVEVGQPVTARIWLENRGTRRWSPNVIDGIHDCVRLRVGASEVGHLEVRLRHMVEPGERAHFVFDIPALQDPGRYGVDVDMISQHEGDPEVRSTRVLSTTLVVAGDAAPRYGVDCTVHGLPASLAPGSRHNLRVALRNTGSMTWRSQPPDGRSVDVGMFLDGEILATLVLPGAEVAPGGRTTIHRLFEAPMEPGPHVLSFDLVEQMVSTFADAGIAPCEVPFTVRQTCQDTASDLLRTAARVDPWHYQPTQGVPRLSDGQSLPVFATGAQGCWISDIEGRRYLDYTMGWGTTVLGYAHPRVTQALTAAVQSPGLLAYAQPVEIEVSRMLVEDFPSGEMVVYGKNGSDVCTLAARMARVHTGRKTILYSGYHGWGDFWAEQAGFAGSGIPERGEKLIHRFRFNDARHFMELFEQHRDDLACVMLEPSGPWGGNEVGHEPDIDVPFLRLLRAKTSEAGALLVFDEIVTGYRYLQGSVQAARGVTPDLTCVGKSIASGLPLSALLGPEALFRSAYHRCHYGPTFMEEAHSFAAARATIEVCRAEPVAEFIWDHGERLRAGIEAGFRSVGFPAYFKGPPFRMNIFVDEGDPGRKLQMRTLLQQELLRSGISIYNNGVMLPCFAHDDATLAETIEKLTRAADLVARAAQADRLEERIEIPLLADM